MKYNSAAKHAIKFVENLTLVGDNLGEPVKLLPFQKDILAGIFGKLDRKKQRLVKRALLFLPRKQAKTFLIACIVLYWLLGRGLKGQQVLSIANDQKQAAILFEMCQHIIEADPELDAAQGGLCEVVPSTKRIVVPSTGSFYAALSCEKRTKTGYSPSLVIVDEAQDITDAELIKNITKGRAARSDYLTLFLGTAGTRKDTPFFAEYEYAKQWRAGIIDNPNYAAWIYEALTTDKDGNEVEKDWKDEKTWRETMPAYGKFCHPENVREEFEIALKMPHEEAAFKQFNLNLWQIYGGVKWVNDVDWMANNSPPLYDATEYWAGWDGASVLDTSSLVLFGLNSQGLWDVIPFIWVCRKQVEDREGTEFSYMRWEEKGFLRVTDGSAQEVVEIAKQIETEILPRYKIRQLAMDAKGSDQWFYNKVMTWNVNAVGVGQDMVTQGQPIKQLQKLILGRKLAHGGNPVLRWMVNNIHAVTDGSDNIKFSKKHSEDKIDGAQALANAIAVAYPTLADEEFAVNESVYEHRGLLVL